MMTHISPVALMTVPFLECLVLVGIHSYLGLHVIRRQVIFVDLSLAQIAALGTTVGFLLGIHPHSFGAFWFSMSFTFLGAAIFALTRGRKSNIPQEAVIGIVYAIAAALVVLVIDRAPHGAEHIKEMLTGNILWVKKAEVLRAAIAYSAVGIFHYIFRDKFLLITRDAELARVKGLNIPFWDFLFYTSFGFVITFSVNTAGVLLVFVFLIVPAAIGVSITTSFRKQLILGWVLGTIVSMVGLALSYWLDLPSGPAVVAFYGLVLLLVGLALYVVRNRHPLRALRNLLIGIVVLIGIIGYFWGLKAIMLSHPGWARGEYSVNIKADEPKKPVHKKEARTLAMAQKLDSLDIDSKKAFVDKVSDPAVLRAMFQKVTHPGSKLRVAQRLTDIDKVSGAKLLVKLAGDAKMPLMMRYDAMDSLSKACGKKLGDPTKAADIHAAKKCVDSLGTQAHSKAQPRQSN